MTDKDDRSERLRKRLQDDGGSGNNESKTAKMSKKEKTSKIEKTSKSGKTSKTEKRSVKDRPSVLMYLPQDLYEELDLTYDQLNLQCKRKHGDAIAKNRDWYPAVVQAGLENTDRLKELLDL